MKGVKSTCYGLLLVFAIMLGLSLNVSSDASALKHPLSGIPLYYTRYDNGHGYTVQAYDGTFQFQFPSGSAPSFSYIELNQQSHGPKWFTSELSGSSCNWLGTSYSSLLGAWHYQYNTLSFTPFYNDVNFTSCNSLRPFGTSDKPAFPDISAHYPELRRLNPYSYEYNAYIYSNTWTDPDTGLSYTSNGLSMSDVLGFELTHRITNPSYLNIPIGNLAESLPYDSSEHIDEGTPIDFNYEIYLTELLSYDLSVSEASVVKLYYSYSSNYQIYTDNLTCDKDISFDGYGQRFVVACHFIAPRNVDNNNIVFNLSFSSGDGYSSIWDVVFDDSGTDHVGGDIAFWTDGLYIVTNYDDTPGSPVGPTLSGSDTSSAPGSAQHDFNYDHSDIEPNWFDSIVGSFNFGFLNPFQPLFNLFSDNTRCAQIPTISSWLHTTDTEVCPWFPSSVRQVLTPVFGLSSSMLIFGFAVRWLGSGSGNFYDDAQSHESGRFKVRSRGVIKS